MSPRAGVDKFIQPDDGIVVLSRGGTNISAIALDLAAEFVADELSHRSLEWSEDLHPRDDHGRFDSGDGGGSSGGKEKDETFLSSPDDAVKSLLNGENVTVTASDVRSVVMQAKDEPTPIDLTRLTVEGKQIFAGGLNRDRLSMPQIPRQEQEKFLTSLKKDGITVTKENVAPSSLLPTQNEISANRVGAKLNEYNSEKGKLLRPIMTSKDNYVLDGHHRWAVMAVVDVENPRLGVKMPILRIGQNHREALLTMSAFNKKHGIKSEALAARRQETAVHKAADAHLDAMTTAVMYGFLKGRKAYKSGDVDAAVTAIRAALLVSLPPVLLKTLVAGGDAGLGMLPKVRAAEQLVPRCSKCSTPKRDPEQEHPGVCVCGGYIDDVPRTLADPINLRFDGTDPAAAKWAREHASKIADDISQTSKDDINEAIAQSLEGEGLDYDVILAAVGDEARADMIARTETQWAAHEGQQQGWDQAVEAGLLTGNEQVVWIATSGACDVCSDLDGMTRPIDDDYDDADAADGPPQHPACRCTEGISAEESE